MGFKEAIRTCVREKYITFSGRASRSEYWYFILFTFLAAGIPLAIGGIMIAMSGNGGGAPVLATIFMGLGGLIYLGLFIPTISVQVRRFHDRNLSGWWVLGSMIAGAIPYIGTVISLVVLVITVLKGTDGENRFGSDPLQTQHQAEVFA